MGALQPILSVAGGLTKLAGAAKLVTDGISLVSDTTNNEIARRQSQKQQELALKQLQAQQGLQERQLAAQTALEKEKLSLQTRQAEDARKAALRRAVARQRASFGSQGVGSTVGSSQAVLLGLFEESDEERKRREALDSLRTSALDLDNSQKRAINVLQRTQLAERNKLDDLASYGSIGANVSNFFSGASNIFSNYAAQREGQGL